MRVAATGTTLERAGKNTPTSMGGDGGSASAGTPGVRVSGVADVSGAQCWAHSGDRVVGMPCWQSESIVAGAPANNGQA